MPFIGNDLFPDDKIIVITFDEITSANAPVFAVAYQLINEGRVGEHVFKPNVRICAAGNRAIDKGIVNRMPMPLCNRMIWYEIGVDVDAWCGWAQSVGAHPIFIAFMQARKNLLCTYDPASSEQVVATPRTWSFAIDVYMSNIDPDLKRATMEGAVGSGPVNEFYGYLQVWSRVIPIKRILADPEGTPLPVEPDMEYATGINISGSMTVKNVAPLHKYLVRMRPEFVVMAWQLATQRDKALFNTSEFMDFSRRFRDVFTAR
jgi:hypothetical protein